MLEETTIALAPALIHSQSAKAVSIAQQLRTQYRFVEPERSNIIIVVGGDGELLHALHRYRHLKTPFYGINSGSIGFLMNSPANIDVSLAALAQARAAYLYPLEMKVYGIDGKVQEALAINEVSIFRSTNQAAKLKIEIDEVERMAELIADGVIISTPAGSSAYNLSAGGQILPLDANLLCLTPICPFRPRRWHGALLPFSAAIRLTVLEGAKRPVNAVADFHEFSEVKYINVRLLHDKSSAIKLMFDPNHSLEDRIIKEQFSY